MSWGKCLVVTQAGLLGIPGDPPCIVAKVGQMAPPIIELLADQKRRHMIDERAYAFARENFASEKVYDPLLRAIRQAADAAPGSRGFPPRQSGK